MSVLSEDEREALRQVLFRLFDDRQFLAPGFTPNTTTLHYTETMLLEAAECERRIDRLLRSLPCAVISRGFLRRCLEALQRVLDSDGQQFAGCSAISRARWRSVITLSGMR
ncbi:hypothetical protein [Sediminicurvatus halobius]|uniref:Uncharacterized protein n=1 Tax=Sediminicurvatus halobius TaxID=2182432 RepID=A0A2U2N4Q1_9GAMM|nr:hypothetical protein [Spiribacter halobius]PWG64027.1 hypothetical protein DEM34_05855 [Spiribacter halobius]UEX76919.1 hypothetical protein LMH63_13265 [Spiribacter halobius]